MTTCKHCDRPATLGNLCPYHGGATLRTVLNDRCIGRQQFREILGGVCNRTIDKIHANKRKLSPLELRGLLSIPEIDINRIIQQNPQLETKARQAGTLR